MRGLFTLAIVLTLAAGCTKQPENATTIRIPQSPVAQSPAVQAPTPEATKEAVESKDIPPEFKDIDFKNRSYPVPFNRHGIRLKDGKFESREGLGGISYGLADVYYADLNQDGSKEAIVELFQLTCGGSCDGGTDLFYFYSLRRGKLALLTKLEIGSFAYDCGLKSFNLKERNLALETFRSCRFAGSSVKPVHNDPGEAGGKLSTNRYTQFDLRFDGTRFVQRKRKVFSYPDIHDFKGHERKIEISGN